MQEMFNVGLVAALQTSETEPPTLCFDGARATTSSSTLTELTSTSTLRHRHARGVHRSLASLPKLQSSRAMASAASLLGTSMLGQSPDIEAGQIQEVPTLLSNLPTLLSKVSGGVEA